MKKLLPLFVLPFFIFGCSEDEQVKNFKFQLAPRNPPVIFASRNLPFVVDGDIIEFPIAGPSIETSFNVVNDNTKTITISAGQFKVTGPDGETRAAQIFNGLNSERTHFGVFKPEKDLNCDGEVTDADTPTSAPAHCELDDLNPSYTGVKIYLYDLMQGLKGDDLETFRGGSFTFEIRLEGWVGTPEAPEKSFSKTITTTVDSDS